MPLNYIQNHILSLLWPSYKREKYDFGFSLRALIIHQYFKGELLLKLWYLIITLVNAHIKIISRYLLKSGLFIELSKPTIAYFEGSRNPYFNNIMVKVRAMQATMSEKEGTTFKLVFDSNYKDLETKMWHQY